MVNPFTQRPEPHLFKGGNASDYEVFTGEAGTWCTRHSVSGETIQSVRPAIDMTLMVFALPETIDNISQLIKKEFELEIFPKLRGLKNLDIHK